MNCTVVFAAPGRQLQWTVALPDGACVRDALLAARSIARCDPALPVPWDTAPIGVFGQRCSRDQPLREGDRVEIYRPLVADPKESRRLRARRAP